MSPETVNTSGVVGQATSFDLTLTGGSPYTYTQTFGNICDVSINNDTATVTITPVTSGTLTGSITFNNEATCNITIDVAEPSPPSVVTVTPSTVSKNGIVGQVTSFDLTLTGETPYTYTQTFGNICNVSINENIATVSITPTETGTLTGSITFNEEATCNITITVSEPTPPSVVTVTPSTVSENGVVGQDTSFDLTLSGASTYTYTHTFGYNCSVSINDNIATVTITPTESGTLTGSITFNNEATCNITIDVSEPQPEPPTTGFEPTEVNLTMPAFDTAYPTFTLLPGSYDSSIEKLEFANSLSGSDDFTSSISIGEDKLTVDTYKLTVETNNQTEHTISGVVNVYANIFDKTNGEYLRNYEAKINLTVAG